MEAEEIGQGGSSAADMLPPAVPGHQQQTLAAARAVQEEEQPGPSFAAISGAAAANHAGTHHQPAAEASFQEQTGLAAPIREQATSAADCRKDANAADPADALPEAAATLAQPIGTSVAVKAPDAPALVVPSIFQDTVDSDSEGPMPSIDSGPSDSETDE